MYDLDGDSKLRLMEFGIIVRSHLLVGGGTRRVSPMLFHVLHETLVYVYV